MINPFPEITLRKNGSQPTLMSKTPRIGFSNRNSQDNTNTIRELEN